MRDFNSLVEALPTGVLSYVRGKYSSAIQVMIGGSYAKGSENKGSDVDVLVVLPKIDAITREVIVLPSATLDVTIHDYESAYRMLNGQRSMSICAFADDVKHCICLNAPTAECKALIAFATQIIAEGPNKAFEFDSLRALLLGQAADLEFASTASERLVIATGICHKLATFAVRSKGGWIGTGKYLARDLDVLYPSFLARLCEATAEVLSGGPVDSFSNLVREVLRDHFGSLQSDWRQHYPGL